jgi:hypothetical protein
MPRSCRPVTHVLCFYSLVLFSASNAWLISSYYRSKSFDNSSMQALLDATNYLGMPSLFIANYLGSKKLLEQSPDANSCIRTAISNITICYRFIAIIGSTKEVFEIALKSVLASYFCAALIAAIFLPAEIFFYDNRVMRCRANGTQNSMRYLSTMTYGLALAGLYTKNIMDKTAAAGLSTAQKDNMALATFIIIALGGSLGYSKTVTNIANLNNKLASGLIYFSCAVMASITANNIMPELEQWNANDYTGWFFAPTHI